MGVLCGDDGLGCHHVVGVVTQHGGGGCFHLHLLGCVVLDLV